MILWYRILELLPFSWVEFDFMKNALLAVILVSFLFGHLGALVINKQMAFFSEALGHAALTGIAIGVILGLHDPVIAMIVFSVLLAFGISYLRKLGFASTDTIIGLVMAFSVALGVVILSRGGGFTRYSKYLIGDILSISHEEILRLIVANIFVLIFLYFFFNKVFLVSLNQSLARSRHINTWLMEAVFSILIALVVTISIQWVGLLVINSLLILPPSAARNVAQNTFQYIWISVVISLVSGVSGLLASYYWGTATGATIVIFSMAFFLISLVLRMIRRK